MKRVECLTREALANPDVETAEERSHRRPMGLGGVQTGNGLRLPARVVATDDSAPALEVRHPPLLAREMGLERRLDLRPAPFERNDVLDTSLVPPALDLLDFLLTESKADNTVVCLLGLDTGLLGRTEPLLDLALRILQARHIGEPERRKRERLERTDGHDFLAHGPLLFLPRICGG